MNKPLPVLRPLLLAAVLPLTVFACVRTLGAAHQARPAATRPPPAAASPAAPGP